MAALEVHQKSGNKTGTFNASCRHGIASLIPALSYLDCVLSVTPACHARAICFVILLCCTHRFSGCFQVSLRQAQGRKRKEESYQKRMQHPTHMFPACSGDLFQLARALTSHLERNGFCEAIRKFVAFIFYSFYIIVPSNEVSRDPPLQAPILVTHQNLRVFLHLYEYAFDWVVLTCTWYDAGGIHIVDVV